MQRLIPLLAAACFSLLAPTTAAAQTAYPNKPIRLIVPTPAGGPSDAAARLVAQVVGQSLGQAVIIDNKPGASGALAAQALMAAPADGHVLMWTLSSMAGLAYLQKSSPIQSLAELTPVTLVGHFSYGLFTSPDLPPRSAAELAEHLRTRSDALSYATGSLADYMVTTKFLKTTGTRAVRVPYRGGPQLMPDLLSGRVQFNFGPLSSGLAQAKEGKLRLLAVLSSRRSPLAPEVPTLAEAGLATVSAPTWQGIFGPAGMPTQIAERWSREVAALVANPEWRTQLERLALQVEGSTPAGLAAAVARDTQVWRSFVQEYDIPQE
jgi:tripartite-type tricarboxylate transporter receptor subunit TctC